MSNPPPAYYYPSGAEQAPLLAQPAPTTTVVYQQESSSAGKKCCGVSLAVCIFICVCCGCIIVVLGAIFGAWASRCSSIEQYRVENHEGRFSGAEAKIQLQCNGDILVTSHLAQSASIQTTTTISAPDNVTAMSIPFDYTSTSSEFSLEFYWNFWNCPREDIHAEVFDYLNAGTSYDFEVTSISGEIAVERFSLLTFEDVELVAYSGSISASGLKLTEKLKIFAANGAVSVNGTVSQELDLTTSNAAVTLNAVASGTYDVVTTNGAIKSTLLEVTSLGEACKVKLRTSNDDIVIDALHLPTTVTCVIDIETTNGPISLKVKNFYGQYSAKTYNGHVTVNGVVCSNSHCEGNVAGPVSHTLHIGTSNSDITLDWI